MSKIRTGRHFLEVFKFGFIISIPILSYMYYENKRNREALMKKFPLLKHPTEDPDPSDKFPDNVRFSPIVREPRITFNVPGPRKNVSSERSDSAANNK
eukprot:TRINITY_DN12790_c0_g1_i1.p1 TRINITY_DN12790_c0_g1~~TRINITY_DN12790_c0_g1_i1.p1  ORF type:complete len:105 (+),score=13.11 TRINITY_DN12790_c0_g1_i1:23-316(+)